VILEGPVLRLNVSEVRTVFTGYPELLNILHLGRIPRVKHEPVIKSQRDKALIE